MSNNFKITSHYESTYFIYTLITPKYILSLILSTGYVLKRLDHMHVFSIMFFTYAIIFGLYSIIENPIWILPVEILNGSLYGLTFAAALSYATLVTPVGSEGTLVGIVGMVFDGIGL